MQEKNDSTMEVVLRRIFKPNTVYVMLKPVICGHNFVAIGNILTCVECYGHKTKFSAIGGEELEIKSLVMLQCSVRAEVIFNDKEMFTLIMAGQCPDDYIERVQKYSEQS